MSHLFILNLGKGDWQQGFSMVVAQLWMSNSITPMQMTGSLPPAPEFSALYPRWQKLYEALYAHRSWRKYRVAESNFEIEDDESYITDVSEVEFQRICQEIQQGLNIWLNADSFRNIDRQLHTRLNPTDEIRVIITAENHHLLRLPWHLWHFFEDYPRAELALSLPEYAQAIKANANQQKSTVKILAILGNSEGIDIATDRKLLEQLPNVELQFLVEPKLEELNQQLWQPGWDILFFAGHSSSQENSHILQINRNDSISLEQLRFGLKKAIERGLKLAIFNSCDGLEIAWNLVDLQIPQAIVMREPVSDRVAQEFLKNFLVAFSGGQSFYLSVREAREQLQALETEFPCATWLPVICQNPAELPPKWNDWLSKTDNKEQNTESKIQLSPLKKRNLIHTLVSSIAVTGLMLGVRSLGFLQPLELWAFDRLLTLRPNELPDNRFLIVTINEADIQAQDSDRGRSSLSDKAFNQLLNRIEPHQPRAIGIDVYRDFATKSQYPTLIAHLRQNKRLVAICKGSDAKYDPTGIAPPPEVPPSRVGFSDFLEDDDGVLRRQLLFVDPDPASPCTTPYAFNVRLAFRYLETKGISPQFTSEGNLKLGKVEFKRLQRRTGGYQGIDAAGNQIILNYRSLPSLRAIAPQVTLNDVLSGKVRPEAIKGRIVLIGVTANSSSDFWATPYGSATKEKVPGVFIQANMTSQILSAVLDKRSLIWVGNLPGEILWIWTWALIGGLSVIWLRSPLQRTVTCVIIVVILIGISFVFLIQGSWVPLVPAGIIVVISVSISSYLNPNVPT
ncbi:CHASE2 domain-containing protein [Phormidium sp. LEGE 05292]|uniref:CHASE2 domain-containing protein n=1 Tax=[Phormidium] sp. LEGE 05292 TaxID=767427 RepID=UPI00188210AF|nr:CHASE2 domain-containing protein [Phormidium sp. LEGE 05292]MBE9228802.1 CHASE2 domain-containing protein [Phormidium sp. LEGE 05292]